ncbi:hypothetical protein [Pseudonocardia humida]|uniref:Uncharacterized protein n=1 Tax=Pseudonocardia humida TaxID=2800819 RepID=A0ABT1A4Q9_9PSEU|nr:hypothetical protein [Pseudonocardia humida]MCO1657999.1 hypothetical protein [Pseudonocardia humida]
MNGSTDPGARRFRGGLLVGLSALLTAVGHLAGGGALPDLAPLAVLLPALAWPVVALADRCRGTVGTLVVLGGGQLLLHELLSTAHSHHAAPDDPSMVLTHALVTALTAAALRFADRGMAAVAAALGRVVPRRPPAAPADRPLAVLVVPGTDVPAAVRRVLSATHARRGPPVRC